MSLLLPGELRAPRAPRLSPSPLLPGELSWPELSFSSLEEAEAFARALENNLLSIESLASPSRLRADAQELEEESSAFLRALESERCLVHIGADIRMHARGFRARALELKALADKREALVKELEASLEELEELILELRFPLLAI